MSILNYLIDAAVNSHVLGLETLKQLVNTVSQFIHGKFLGGSITLGYKFHDVRHK